MALALASIHLVPKGAPMDIQVQDKIAQAAQAEHGWSSNEVQVSEVPKIRTPSCSFFTVSHKVRPLSYRLNYALLPDGQVLGLSTGEEAAARILEACGAPEATPGWSAEIIARFHPEFGAGLVLHDEEQDPRVIRRMKAAGKTFAAPAFVPGEYGGTLTFYLMEYESNILYQATVTRQADGALHVSKAEVF
jgi:hypothetical protein